MKVPSGTYVRTLVEDMGKKLGTGVHMSGLRRTQVGDYKITGAMNISDFSYEVILVSIRNY